MNNKTRKLLRKRQDGANLTKNQKKIYRQFNADERALIREKLTKEFGNARD
jgi:hypothetical protein